MSYIQCLGNIIFPESCSNSFAFVYFNLYIQYIKGDYMLFTSRVILFGENCKNAGTVLQKDALNFIGQFRISCTCDLLKSSGRQVAFGEFSKLHLYLHVSITNCTQADGICFVLNISYTNFHSCAIGLRESIAYLLDFGLVMRSHFLKHS